MPLTLHTLSDMESLDDSITKGRDGMKETSFYKFDYSVLSDMARSLSTFFCDAGLLRRALGDEAHLAEEYVEMLLEAANAMYPIDIAEDGFDAGRELHGICRDIVEGANQLSAHPFHNTASLYIHKNPISEGDRTTQIWVYVVALYASYLEYAVNAFNAHMNAEALKAMQGQSFDAVRESILGIAGEEGRGFFHGMEASYDEFFSLMPALAVYLRGSAYYLVDAMMHVDADTKRRVYQIILDNPLPEIE